MQLIGITNSQRAGSLNRMALDLVRDCLPAGSLLEVQSLAALPFYDIEIEESGFPLPVLALARAVAHADGLVIASPEFNHSVPPAIKNALDWLSRVGGRPLRGKAVLILSATPGPLGGARMQYELRRVLEAVGAWTLVRPEVFIAAADGKFDAGGHCTDGSTRAAVTRQVAAFASWVEVVARARSIGAEQT